MTIEDVLNNMKKLKGKRYNYYDIICVYEDYTYNDREDVICTATNIHTNINSEDCRLCEAYINDENAPIINIYVNSDDIIVDVEIK